MANKNEAKIKFTAETGEFNKAIKQANDEMSELRAELKLNATQMASTGNTVEALEKQHSLLENQLKASQSKTEVLSQKVSKAAEIYGENSTEVTKLKTQLANAQTAEEKIKQAISECNTQIEKQTRESKETESATSQLTDKIDKQRSRVDQLKKEYVEAVLQFGKNSKEAKTLAKEIDDLSAELNTNEKRLSEAERAANDLEKEFDDVDKSAGKVGDTLSKIGGTIATGAVAGLTAITAAAGAAGKALIDMSVNGAAYADDVLTTSTQTGIATDKLQEYQYAAELVDVSTETLTKSMAKNIKSMKGVQDGTKLSVEAYEKLGVAVTNSDGSLRDGQTVYWEVIDALGKVENETERDALAMQILGKSAQELNPLIEAGSKKMQELGQQAHDAGYVLGDETLNAYGALDDELQYLKVGAEGAKNALGAVLLPVLTDLAGTGNDLLSEFTNGVAAANGDVDKIGDVIGAVLPKAINKIVSYVPQILSLVMSIVQTLSSSIMSNLPTLVNSAMGIVTSLVTTLTENIPTFISAGIQIITSLLSGITEAVPKISQAVVDMIPKLVTALQTGLPELVKGVVELFTALVESVDQILPILNDTIDDIIIAVVDALATNLPALLDGCITLVLALVDALPQIIIELTKAMPMVIESIVTALLNCLPKLLVGIGKLIWGVTKSLPVLLLSPIQQTIGIMKGLWNGIKNVFAPVGNWFKDKFNDAKEKATAAWSDAKSKFSETWSKVKDAFSNVGGWFKDQFNQGKENAKTAWSNAKTIFSNIWNGIKNVFSNIGGWFKDKFNSAKESAINTWSNIKSKFSSIKDGIINAFSNIKEKLSAPFEKARDTIKGIADKIKGFFKGEISMPKIKVPHFGISPKGWKVGDLLEGSIPKLSIDWYADGGIMTKPTIFGMNGSRLMAGGEAGYEAILPIDRLQDYVSNAVERSMQALNLNAFTDAIADLANRPVDVYVNGRKFAHATVGDTDRVQGLRNRLTDRGVLLD